MFATIFFIILLIENMKRLLYSAIKMCCEFLHLCSIQLIANRCIRCIEIYTGKNFKYCRPITNFLVWKRLSAFSRNIRWVLIPPQPARSQKTPLQKGTGTRRERTGQTRYFLCLAILKFVMRFHICQNR